RRLALVVGTVWLTSWALEATHVAEPSTEVTLISAALAVALLQAGLVWLFYLALEPWVRRLWPHTLVSWSRLLCGRVHDRLVGRSLLLGSLLGAFWTVCVMLDRLAPRLLGLAPPAFPVDSAQLGAVVRGRDLLATLLDLPIGAVYDGLFSLLLLLLLRLVLRRWWPAVIAYMLITGVVETLLGSAPQVSWLLLGIGLAVTGTYALVRFGLLTLIIAFLVQGIIEAYPLTRDLSAWYADSGLFALAVATLLATTGYWLTRREGRGACVEGAAGPCGREVG
ncbi:MAG: hypothetical protein GY836_06790, partial [Herbaspirillum sp.]|uniref:hypothetical protein n=1 Tax=Herbaspirillum sp. TaxID=1890675 RepID=UPI00258BBF56